MHHKSIRPEMHGNVWFGYNDPEFNENFEDILKNASTIIFFVGLFLYILKLDIDI